MRRALLLLVLTAAAAGLTVARSDPPAAVAAGSPATVTVGDVSASAAVSTQTLHSTGAHTFTLAVTLVNGGPATQAQLNIDPGRWPGPDAPAGNPLDVGSPAASAGATVTPLPPAPIPFLPPWACTRGPVQYVVGGTVTLPAATSVTVTWPITAVVPAWPHTALTPGVTVDGVTVPVAPVRMSGPTAVRVRVAVGPATYDPVGRPIILSGSTDPSVRHVLVRLRARRYSVESPSRPGRLALSVRVRTDARGRFVLRGWTPHALGEYAISAWIGRPGPGHVPAGNCAADVLVAPSRDGQP